MKTKVILFLTALILTVTAICSCQIPGMGGAQTGGGETKLEFKKLVAADGQVDVMELVDIRTTLFNAGYQLSVISESEEQSDGEIVFGDSSRDITAAAKVELEKQFAKDGAELGYIIYSDGKNVAVYWTEEEMKSAAFSAFIKKCLDTLEMKLEAGVLYYIGYTSGDYSKEKGWLALEAQGCDSAIIAELKAINELFDGSYMMGWFANLWDPVNGGFYFSNSARDNEPFLPDLESTYQVLAMVPTNGATAGLNKNSFFPNEMKRQMVEFAKNMQSPANGYFLHPQWPQSISALKVDRYSRDLDWAQDIIGNLRVDTDGDGVEENQYPNYCTPGGLKCEAHSGTAEKCSYATATVSTYYTGLSGVTATASLGSDISAAVSKVKDNYGDVVAVATVSSRPDYSSSQAFKNWVMAYCGGMDNFIINSGMAHEINAMKPEIVSKGFCDELNEVLCEVLQYVWDYQEQNGMEQSGVWQLDADLGAVKGIHKYMPFLNDSTYGVKLDLDMAYAMTRTCIKVILTPLADLKGGAGGKAQLNDLMNMWTSINHIKTNVNKYYGQEAVEEINNIVRESAVDCLENTITNLNHYKIGSGQFAFTYNRVSLASMYGCPASLGVEEADVNGVLMTTNLYKAIFSSMGYSVVDLCTSTDGENFLRIIEGLEPIEKIPVVSGVTHDFESDDLSAFTTIKNSSLMEVEITSDPKDSSNSVLHFKSGIRTDGDQGDYLKVKPGGLGGNCYIFETEVFYVNDSNTTKDAAAFQILIGNLYVLTMGMNSSNNVAFGYRTSQGNPSGVQVKNGLVTAKSGSWVKIRLEIYTADSTDDGTVKIKYFLNDKYVLTDTHFSGSHDPAASMNTGFTTISFYSRYSCYTDVYLDNCYFNVENKEYSATEHDISDSRD